MVFSEAGIDPSRVRRSRPAFGSRSALRGRAGSPRCGIPSQMPGCQARAGRVAVHASGRPQSDLTARRVTEFEFGALASRDHVAGSGAPHAPVSPCEHLLIGLDSAPHPAGLRALGFPLERDHLAFRPDSRLACCSAVRAGVGIGFVREALAARDPGSSRPCSASICRRWRLLS